MHIVVIQKDIIIDLVIRTGLEAYPLSLHILVNPTYPCSCLVTIHINLCLKFKFLLNINIFLKKNKSTLKKILAHVPHKLLIHIKGRQRSYVIHKILFI